MPTPCWIDTHCHLDAPEFAADGLAVRETARAAGVGHCVLVAVQRSNWRVVRDLAHATGDSYALGIHPLFTPQAQEGDIAALRAMLVQWRDDPHLVAVGEIGLDFFVPALTTPSARARQQWFYAQQVQLARELGLPVIVHVRQSSDALLKVLRATPVAGGIAHAFNGSWQQAQAFIGLGFKLGFGGAMTYERALRLRDLARRLPLDSLVLETDAPDMLPQWLYRTAAERAAGQPQGRNSSLELPRIAQALADLRGIRAQTLAEATGANARQVLQGLPAWGR
ncbi:TatD family hydrolase [Comamonas nitrativorans]|uniref:TatD family hydrolase n=1 Tax=Comamonas nitrativorans TaxID=108437 RepID=A0ABV9GX57_9BURK